MDENQPKNHHYLLIGFSLIFLVIIGSFVWQNYLRGLFNRYISHGQAQFEASYVRADKDHDLGNYDAAIAGYSKILADATNPLTKAKIQAKLANDLIARGLTQNNDGDIVRGLSIQKSIISDKNTSPMSRALLLNEMASFLIDNEITEYFVRENFKEDPYVSYLPKAAEKQQNVVRDFTTRLYEESDKIFPNAFAKIGIARNQQRELAGIDFNSSTGKDISKKSHDYLAEATELINAIQYEPIQNLKMFYYRAIIANSIYVRSKLFSYEEVTRFYEDALSESKKDLSHAYTSYRIFTSIGYADFIKKYGDDGSGSEKIKSLLEQITKGGDGKNEEARAFLAKIFTSSNFFIKNAALDLAKTHTDFGDYLEELGWKL